MVLRAQSEKNMLFEKIEKKHGTLKAMPVDCKQIRISLTLCLYNTSKQRLSKAKL